MGKVGERNWNSFCVVYFFFFVLFCFCGEQQYCVFCLAPHIGTRRGGETTTRVTYTCALDEGQESDYFPETTKWVSQIGRLRLTKLDARNCPCHHRHSPVGLPNFSPFSILPFHLHCNSSRIPYIFNFIYLFIFVLLFFYPCNATTKNNKLFTPFFLVDDRKYPPHLAPNFFNYLFQILV